MRSSGPPKEEKPFFDGWDTKESKFSYACTNCLTPRGIAVEAIQKASWTWQDDLEATLLNEVSAHFCIDLNNRFIGNGMKTVVSDKCDTCGYIHFAYFNIHEYANSCYRVVFLGMAIQ